MRGRPLTVIPTRQRETRQDIMDRIQKRGGIRMKKYSLFCNMCGREIRVEKGIAREGVLSVEQNCGYF